MDKTTEVLKNPENQPKIWLHKPKKEVAEKFETKIVEYEKTAKKVRANLLSTAAELYVPK